MSVARASDLTMAPSNFTGKFSSVLQLSFAGLPHLVTLADWHDFCQTIVENLSLNVDQYQIPIPVKFHWGKNWEIATVNGKNYLEYFKGQHTQQIAKFKKDIKTLVNAGTLYSSDTFPPNFFTIHFFGKTTFVFCFPKFF